MIPFDYTGHLSSVHGLEVLVNPLTPDLNPTVQWQSPEIFYWGF